MKAIGPKELLYNSLYSLITVSSSQSPDTRDGLISTSGAFNSMFYLSGYILILLIPLHIYVNIQQTPMLFLIFLCLVGS